MAAPLHVRIREARERAGLKVSDVAREAGLDHAHLARFERGEKGMSTEKIDLLLAALGLEVAPALDPAGCVVVDADIGEAVGLLVDGESLSSIG